MSASSLSEFENGKSVPGSERLAALATMLEVGLDIPAEPEVPHYGNWRDFEQLELPPVFQAALDVFAEVGFHGATVRMIAERCGMSMAGVYYYVDSKDALLTGLLGSGMAELEGRCLAADAAAGSPRERLANLVECLVLFHTRRQSSAVLASTELRSLDLPRQQLHLQSRSRVRCVVQGAVEAWRGPGRMGAVPAASTAIAIVTMCVAVSDWYQGGVSSSPQSIAAEYVDLAVAMVDACSDFRVDS